MTVLICFVMFCAGVLSGGVIGFIYGKYQIQITTKYTSVKNAWDKFLRFFRIRKG